VASLLMALGLKKLPLRCGPKRLYSIVKAKYAHVGDHALAFLLTRSHGHKQASKEGTAEY
jgi:hypothetical protein